MENRGAIRCRQSCRLLVGQIASNAGRGDLGDLVPVDKSMAVLGTYDDPVELVQLGYLQNVDHFPELGTGCTEHGSLIRESKVRNRFSFIHDGLLCGRGSDSGRS